MNSNLEISTIIKEDVTILQLKGDVTAVTGKTVEETYAKVTLNGANKILLLFNEDNYINSGGIAFLIMVASESKKKEQKIFMTGLSEHFLKIFEMVGLTKYIRVFPSQESAMAAFD